MNTTFVSKTLLIIFSALTGLAGQGRCDDDIAENDPILGKWTVANVQSGGEDRENWSGYVYEFSSTGRFTLQKKDGTFVYGGRFEIDGEGDVREFLIESEWDHPSKGGGGPRLGIVKTFHNRRMQRQLVICVTTQAGRPRPDAFEAPEDKRQQLITLVIIREDGD